MLLVALRLKSSSVSESSDSVEEEDSDLTVLTINFSRSDGSSGLTKSRIIELFLSIKYKDTVNSKPINETPQKKYPTLE